LNDGQHLKFRGHGKRQDPAPNPHNYLIKPANQIITTGELNLSPKAVAQSAPANRRSLPSIMPLAITDGC
jgi:hypothetical protein